MSILTFNRIEKEMEEILHTYEQHNKFKEALQGYLEIEEKIVDFMNKSEEGKTVGYRILSQCYLRIGNMYRSLGNPVEANKYNLKELECASRSGDTITYAQSIFSKAINLISNKNVQEGLKFLDQSKELFTSGSTFDHIQGVGWYWIIKADLANKGIVPQPNEAIIEFSNLALEQLLPINNYPGIARAYQARSIAYNAMGETALAQEDVIKTKEYQELTNQQTRLHIEENHIVSSVT
ncbi:hypothetical protein [Peribacillus acanthi]|uniref:hypothetical protein n=1 Tax=Peribacillus acanthi TaxID=2171554 RepID=UPI000D3E7AF6|nr:hypothetical protein [Peribacillus acanthi]